MNNLHKKILLCLVFICGQFRADANQNIDFAGIKNIVVQWSNALNNRELLDLHDLYSEHVLFYCVDKSRGDCIEIKRKALAAMPDFYQKITSDIEIILFESGTIKCVFIKEVHHKGKIKNYPAYLLLKAENGSYKITGEGDELTDSNLNFNLNLGNQIVVPTGSDNVLSSYEGYILIGIIIVLIIVIILILLAKRKTKTKAIDNTFVEILPENPKTESVKIEATLTSEKKFSTEEATAKAKQALTDTLAQTRTFITKVFNTADSLDRMLYGKRMKVFILGSFIVLLIAPLADYLLKLDDNITFIFTLAFLFFILVLVLSFIGSWRDDNGNVTWARTKSRLKTYSEILSDTIAATKATAQAEILYKFGRVLFFGGIGWKALQHVSLLIRKMVLFFGGQMNGFMAFEKITNHFFWIPIVSGLGIIIYLYNKNPKIFERIKHELMEFFGIGQKYKNEIVTINSKPNLELVVNAKEEQQLNRIMALSNSVLFKDFALALQNWNPRGAYYEYEYQDRLLRHLRKILPDALIESERPFGKRRRADIVINNTVLIEMKCDSSAGAVQRAIGQIGQYSIDWQNKGPVILLLCDYDFEHARSAYSLAMQDQLKLGRPVLTIVAKTK